MKTLTKIVLLSASIALLSGCASMMSGSTQDVAVNAIDQNTQQPLTTAQCEITDSKGDHYKVGSGGKALVNRNKGVLQTTCTAANSNSATVSTKQKFNAWTLGNLIFWPGIIVDVATGAVQRYPKKITVPISS